MRRFSQLPIKHKVVAIMMITTIIVPLFTHVVARKKARITPYYQLVFQ